MRKRWIVALNLDKLTNPNKIGKANEIVSAMQSNAVYFPAPDPPLADITAQINTTQQAYLASRDAGSNETAIFRNHLAQLKRMLLNLGGYVQIQANKQFDIGGEIILAAAMDIKALPTRNVQDFAVKNTPVKGEVKATMKAQGDRVVYLWDYKEKGTDEWMRAGETNQAKYIYTGLKSATAYLFRGSYILINNDKVAFDPVELVVL